MHYFALYRSQKSEGYCVRMSHQRDCATICTLILSEDDYEWVYEHICQRKFHREPCTSEDHKVITAQVVSAYWTFLIHHGAQAEQVTEPESAHPYIKAATVEERKPYSAEEIWYVDLSNQEIPELTFPIGSYMCNINFLD